MMATRFKRFQSRIEQVVALFVFAILVIYSYALFFRAPYAGFEWNPSSGKVISVYVTGMLQPDDQLVKIGSTSVAEYSADLRKTLFEGIQAGTVVTLLVQRDKQRVSIPWTYPGFNRDEFLGRLTSQWWLSLIFWSAGEAALLFLRPKDTRWKLFIAFNFLTAIWLLASTFSKWHIWESAIVLRSAIWLSVPVYWHLHWVLPRLFGRLPRIVGWAVYLIAIVLAGAEWFQLLPVNAYGLGFLLALAGSALLLLAHFIFRPAERRDLLPLIMAGVLAFGLPLGLGLVVAAGQTWRDFLLTLLALPILPVAYFIAASRHRLGNLEVRANRIVSLFFFLFLLNLALITLVALLEPYFHFAGDDLAVVVGTAAIAVSASIFGFPRFQRFVEHHLLGMHLPPTKLSETYARRVIVSPDEQTLIHLLKDEIVPTLFIRQSALLRLDDSTATPVYIHGLEPDQLPSARYLPNLLATAGRYRPATPDEAAPSLPWVRLALALSIEQKPIGLWLLGKRDPDDYYSQQEIEILQSLADQTAIALTNILQAGRLRAFYQADIEANENQRFLLAQELHDNLLNELASLKNSIGEQIAPPHFFERFDAIIASIRQTIGDLRPTMLNYGLGPALDALVDDLSDRNENGPTILFEVSADGTRYDPQVELHVYRIVQQACENTLKHARPKSLSIIGRLSPRQIDLTVEDDGQGFEAGARLDLHGLAAHKHFGLMGMYERAALIKADIQFLSAPGSGTKIRIHWKREGH